MLAHRLRRWPKINPTLVQGLVFVGIVEAAYQHRVGIALEHIQSKKVICYPKMGIYIPEGCRLLIDSDTYQKLQGLTYQLTI